MLKHATHNYTLSGLIGHLNKPEIFDEMSTRMQQFVMACNELFQDRAAVVQHFNRFFRICGGGEAIVSTSNYNFCYTLSAWHTVRQERVLGCLKLSSLQLKRVFTGVWRPGSTSVPPRVPSAGELHLMPISDAIRTRTVPVQFCQQLRAATYCSYLLILW